MITVNSTNNSHGEKFELMAEHSHWSTYDMSLEGCRFNILDGLVRARPFDDAYANSIIAEIEHLAYSKGWADEDSYLGDVGSMTDEKIEESSYVAALKEIHDEDTDAQYSNEVQTSISKLMSVATSPEASTVVASISQRLSDARLKGAQARGQLYDSEDVTPAAPNR